MKTTVANLFPPVQRHALIRAVEVRRVQLDASTDAAAAGRVATTRYEDSAEALALTASRYEALANKLIAVSPLTRDDLEHALVAASVARRAKARSTDRAAAAVLNGVVATLTDALGDEALVHDEY